MPDALLLLLVMLVGVLCGGSTIVAAAAAKQSSAASTPPGAMLPAPFPCHVIGLPGTLNSTPSLLSFLSPSRSLRSSARAS